MSLVSLAAVLVAWSETQSRKWSGGYPTVLDLP